MDQGEHRRVEDLHHCLSRRRGSQEVRQDRVVKRFLVWGLLIKFLLLANQRKMERGVEEDAW